MDIWSSVVYLYSNYISASLSDIFTDKIKKIISKYENYPNNCNFRWLCDEIMSKCGHNRWEHLQSQDEKSQFWFINDTINLHFFEEPFVPYTYSMQSEDELVLTLSYWLFRESCNQLQINTKQLVQFHEHHLMPSDVKVLPKEQLESVLNIPLMNVELCMARATGNEMFVNFNISEGPHYFMPDTSIAELQPPVKNCAGDSTNARANAAFDVKPAFVSYDDEQSNFDLIDSILSKSEAGDTEYDCKLSGIKEELEDLCASESPNSPAEEEPCYLTSKSEESVVSVPRLQIRARHEIQKPDKTYDMYPAVQHKKRGRPKK